MKRRRKPPKAVPQIPPTPLESTEMIDGLKKLSNDALMVELVNATNLESWLNTMAASFKAAPSKDGPPMADPLEAAAGHSRITREVIALILYSREDGKGGPGGPNGKPGPKGGGYL